MVLLFLRVGVGYAQDSEVKQLVDALRTARTKMIVHHWKVQRAQLGMDTATLPAPPIRYHVLVDREPVSDEQLNTLRLTDITQVAFSFDPTLMALGGGIGSNGVILVTRKKVTP